MVKSVPCYFILFAEVSSQIIFLVLAFLKKLNFRDFPSCPVVKNLPSNAGDEDLIPGQGTKIPNATGQLSLHATTTEDCVPQ